MEAVAMAGAQTQASPVAMRAWKPPVAGIREVFHARFREHAYPPHTHDVWTLFIVDEGVIRYDLDRRPRLAEPSAVGILPPHVVHDGRAATNAGFSNRVLYLETDVLGEPLVGPAVDTPSINDVLLRLRLVELHRALACADDALEAETRLAFVVERLRTRLHNGSADPAAPQRSTLAEGLRAFLDARVEQPATMEEAARALDAGTTQLARAFTQTFGITPHAYRNGKRLEAARERILDGQSLADIAAELGFCDQAHFTRRFKQFLGATPGQFARGGQAAEE